MAPATINHTEIFTTARFSVAVPGTFRDVVERFERLIEHYPTVEFAELVARRASWDEIVGHTRELAPLGFLIYWRNAVSEMMTLAGDESLCVSYLMGNHTIAERMFRHDPRVMNYAPLRVEITQEPGCTVLFTFEQPSAQFGSFGSPSIDQVGRELDRLLATLLRAVGADPPPELEDAALLPNGA
jgi:hypothetical protein